MPPFIEIPKQQKPFAKNRKPAVGISPGVVIPIDSRSRLRERKPGSASGPVTQARLAEAFRLHREELRIIQDLREFRLQLEADLAAGCEMEGGDLIYDRELKVVRRGATNGTANNR